MHVHTLVFSKAGVHAVALACMQAASKRKCVCVLCVCVLEFVFECGVWGFGSEHEDFPFNEMED